MDSEQVATEEQTNVVVGHTYDELKEKTREELIELVLSIQHDKNHSGKVPELYNEQGFKEVSLIIIEQARRTGQKFSLMYCDARLFKKVNDKFGRSVGDKAITIIGNTIAITKRKSDVAVHFSGDEFGLLLQTNKGGALILGERIRSPVNEALADVGDAELYPTINIGVGEIGEMPVYEEADENTTNKDRKVVGVITVDVKDKSIKSEDLLKGAIAVAEYRTKREKIIEGDER
jgi:diguanylate cyclase (GGDEF)-like protein